MEEKQLSEDLKFMRSVIERTHRQIDPEAPSMITWGLVCLVMYPSVQLLVAMHLYKWIYPMAYTCVAIGVSLSFWFGHRVSKREKRYGFVSRIRKQINWVWGILVINGLFWSWLATYKHWNPYFSGFLWAAIYGFGLSMMGILHSKEWLFGGIAIFIAILVAYVVKVNAYIILGIVMGLACIIPAIIVHKNYLK